MDSIKWLEKWYQQQCDGEWEHSYGITIEAIDNPGWHIKIDLCETKYAGMNMEKMQLMPNDNDWIVCYIEQRCFHGFGDPLKLSAIIEVFRRQIEVMEI